ncbi:hypothetical protein Tco_0843632 [Tanacetum coccineum]|uniref:Uncharacterized protein n=1 Tax=Tanacetum coccineum TaxID=301880 RepID=A0ABQ5B2T6_9ASTR
MKDARYTQFGMWLKYDTATVLVSECVRESDSFTVKHGFRFGFFVLVNADIHLSWQFNGSDIKSHRRNMALDLSSWLTYISWLSGSIRRKKNNSEGQKDENLNIVKLQRLDVGEGKEVDLKECPKSKLRNASNRLYAGEKKKGKFHHSSFLAGGATLAAGRLDVDNGTLEVCVPIREIANGGISLQK